MSNKKVEATGIKLGGFSGTGCPCASFKSLWTWNMKTNKAIWLPSAFVFVPVAFSYFFAAGFIFFSTSGFHLSRISELFVWGISEPSFREGIIVPVVLATIMLVGMIINIKISADLKKINILFLILLLTVTIPIVFQNVFAMWAAISVTVAWLLQRHTTKTWIKKNS